MIIVFSVASGLIIANKLIGIHIQSEIIDQEIQNELRIVK